MNRILGLAITSIALLGACSDHEFSELQEPNLGVSPEILVEPTSIAFGVVADGQQEIRQFTISNIGEATLQVDGITLVGDGGFTILSQGLDFELEPLSEDETNVRVIDVAFSPLSDADATGQALVNSNDPDNAQVPVDLLGLSSGPFLVVSPDPYDFGTKYVGNGCLYDQQLTLTNEGLEDLVITDFGYADTTGLLDLTQQPALPLTLAPGQSSNVNVNFDAWTSATATGTLSVTSNDPRGVVDAVQYADTQHALTQTDSFTMPTELPVDIVFAVDQSCSMGTILTNNTNNFSTFINTINSVTQDWRIGVLSNDGGCFTGGWIHSGTSNFPAAFNNAVWQDSDGGGSWSERLFTLTESSFNQMGSGCNAGFMRSGALLHVVFVSDEYEQTAGSTGGASARASTFHGNLINAKGSASLVKASGIICPGTSSSSCPSGSPDGSNHGYVDAVNLTGGVQLDITSTDWGASVEELATASLVALGRFELTQSADPSVVGVQVDGSTWTDWHYDMATNSIVFDSLPPAGAAITVTYGVAISCN
ncbi:MAG: choice-of-anchor D domain-containing protein [Proteobacteria bacterium]|nr:choice-of-anchor D domain-containing protein [Pseudomonadota bacterium]